MIHPDIQRLLDARGEVDLSAMSVADARSTHLAGATAGPKGPDMAGVLNSAIDGVAVRRYEPHDATGAALVFFHGGGWVLGSLDTHDRQCRQLAAGSRATVFNVGYRLAPEHPFPAAFVDAVAVTTALLGGAGGTRIDTDRIAVGGDSAGANLAAAVTLALRSAQTTPLRAQLLVYPALDATMASASFEENRDGPFLTAKDMVWFYNHYAGGAEPTDWRLSPLSARAFDALPAALVVTAEFDPLRDEGEEYAHALAAAGSSATAVRYSGTTHGFLGWSHLAEPSRVLMTQLTTWLIQTLEVDP